MKRHMTYSRAMIVVYTHLVINAYSIDAVFAMVRYKRRMEQFAYFACRDSRTASVRIS